MRKYRTSGVVESLKVVSRLRRSVTSSHRFSTVVPIQALVRGLEHNELSENWLAGAQFPPVWA